MVQVRRVAIENMAGGTPPGRSTTDGTGSTVDTLIAKSRLINARMLFPVAPRVHLIKVAVAEGVR
jgi:hypothetical protein